MANQVLDHLQINSKVEILSDDPAAFTLKSADGQTTRMVINGATGAATIPGLTEGGAQAFPVGSVFIGVVSTDPATLLGYGTWAGFGAGKVMVGLDSGDTDFDTAEETGGAKTVAAAGTNDAPTFTGSALGTHTHTSHTLDTVGLSTGADTTAVTTATHSSQSAGTPAGTVSAPAFTGSATSVVQPYIVCYFWKRTA